MTTIEEVVSKMNVGRCVGIEIVNNTGNVTLENPRTHCYSGYVWKEPTCDIPAGSSGRSVFVKTSGAAHRGVGVLSYVSDAFALVIMFSNPFDYNLYIIEFALQLWSGRMHFDKMERLYHYMYDGGPPYQCNSFRKAVLHESNPGELRVHNENIVMTATMSNDYKSCLKVQIEQKQS